MPKLLFESVGWAILRTPSTVWENLPRDLAIAGSAVNEDGDSDRIIRWVEKHSFLRNGLAVASPGLHRRLLLHLASPNDRTDDKNALARSLFLYGSRAAARSTPFGLFAGYCVVPLSDKTSVEIRERASRITLDVDYGYLVGMYSAGLASEDCLLDSYVLRNSMTQSCGDRFVVLGALRRHLSLQEGSASIRKTSVTQFVFREAQRAVTVRHLFLSLQNVAPSMSASRILDFLRSLIDIGFIYLVDAPRPYRYTSNKVADAVRRDSRETIADIRIIASELEGQEMAGWLNKDFGLSQHSFADGNRERSVFHSILHLGSNDGSIGRRVSHDAALAAQLLLGLSRKSALDREVDLYRDRFTQTFGAHAEVMFSRMVSEEVGIGQLKYHGNAELIEADARKRAIRERIALMAADAVWRRQMQIDLPPTLVAEISNISSQQILPYSLDLFFSLVSDSGASIDRGDYRLVVGPAVGIEGAFRSICRFDGSRDARVSQLRRLHSADAQEVASKTRLAGIRYRPYTGIVGNLTEGASAWGWYVDVGFGKSNDGNDESIPIDELAVGVNSGRFYLRWTRTDEIVRIQQSDMISFASLPELVRTLIGISSHGVSRLHRLDIDWARHLPFLPRIATGRVVLQPARWILRNELSRSDSAIDESLHDESLIDWRKTYSVPRWVWLGDGDDRLLLDLETSVHMRELTRQRRKLSSSGHLVLEEAIENPSERWCVGEAGRYMSEIVLPLRIKKSQVGRVQHEYSDISDAVGRRRVRGSLVDELGVERVPPGGEWIYVKLYMSQSIQDYFLKSCVHSFLFDEKRSSKHGLWFYVRYADPDPHVRLRFRFGSHEDSEPFSRALFEWMEGLIIGGVCRSYCIDTYFPEVERYGGTELLPICEDWFARDSELSLRALQSMEKSDLELISALIVACMVFVLASENRRRALCLWSVGPRSSRESKVTHRSSVAGAKALAMKPLVGALLADTRNTLRRFVIDVTARNGAMALEQGDLTDSLIHMHCNRAHGTDKAAERRIRLIASAMISDPWFAQLMSDV
jgi:lantibiotic biosynthesis protein